MFSSDIVVLLNGHRATLGTDHGTVAATALGRSKPACLHHWSDLSAFLGFLLLTLTQTHAGAPTVCVDELDPGSL